MINSFMFNWITFSRFPLIYYSNIIEDNVRRKNLTHDCVEAYIKCKICGNLTDSDECGICTDESRDSNLICVVEDYKSVIMFEKSGTFKGKYHILGGLISPMDGVNPENLNIESLVERIKKLDNPEVIIALTSSIEGEMTMLYLKNILDKYKVKVTRLSYGVPLGMNLDYMDMLSLNKALEDRREIND